MSRRGSSVLFVLLAFFLLLASCAPSRQTPRGSPAAAAPADQYLGAEICKACHPDAFTKFGVTKMGRLFLNQPRNELERRACESCHGPGKAHVESGGGKGVGGLISFGKKDATPVEQRNEV